MPTFCKSPNIRRLQSSVH